MTEEQQLKKIAAGLAEWAQRNGGSVHVAHDHMHLLKILGGNPGTARIGILVAGETPRNDTYSDIETRMDRKFWIAISRGWSLEAYAGKSLVEGIAGGPPLFQLLREAKAAIRQLRFDCADEPTPYYKGYELLTFEGVTLDAYRIEIVVTSDDQADQAEPGPVDNAPQTDNP